MAIVANANRQVPNVLVLGIVLLTSLYECVYLLRSASIVAVYDVVAVMRFFKFVRRSKSSESPKRMSLIQL